ncbi:MAG: AAA-associated domain-containing protein [Thermoplasmata archaeon]|nr:AAA-associated domain-containing protein [Thermoplasmata archaeon]
MPTIYPKCAPSEMMGLLVLLNEHKGEDDLARLADDLDLEIDEILPSSDFAEALQLVRMKDGRITLTDIGRKLLAATIRDRKELLREQLKRTTLFRTLVRALESSAEHQLTEEQVQQLIGVTVPSADSALLNIINWGRFVGLFRFDPEGRTLQPVHLRRSPRSPPPSSGRPPAGGGADSGPSGARSTSSSSAGNPPHNLSPLTSPPVGTIPVPSRFSRRTNL